MFRSLLLLLVLLTPLASAAQSLPTIGEKTEGLDRIDGLFPLYWDEDAGTVWMEVSNVGTEFLYVVSLPTGLGSNAIGLDRNRLGPQRLVRFDRVGRHLFLTAPNLDFRARSDNADEVAATQEAFAEGTLWGFDVAARTGDSFLIDVTPFLVRDAYGVIPTLQGSGQGTFRVDASRSAPWPEVLKSFPQNTEMEARVTFTADPRTVGSEVRSVAAASDAVTLRIRHSFIQLPDDGYEPRAFDPRSGYGTVSFDDYAAPIGEDMTVRWIRRHRLEVDSTGQVIEPIVYYLDRGTPEPVRSALLEGGRWWNQAFEAAGFRDAFRMELLPEGADPMDVRYNVMNWVHRSTRGWSYGYSVADPRTGEILKGHVSLGSLRVRQDYLLMEGLLAPYVTGETPDDDPMLVVALARLRQLSAHEIGHTLGISHNFAASVNDRASVMDYPAPLVTLTDDGTVSLNQAYDSGIGEWDRVAIRYGYTVFPDSVDEREALSDLLDTAHENGLLYLTDQDARGSSAAQPLANLWDNGSNPVTSLQEAMAVRSAALNSFGLFAIKSGRPLATLEEALVPLYLHHRYQVEAAAKVLGGVDYSYALRGDRRALPTAINPELQREGLSTLLRGLEPDFLALPRNLRRTIPPRPPGYGGSRELFPGYTGSIFDPYGPAETAALLVVDQLLNPERMARLVLQADLDRLQPSLSDVLARATDQILGAEPSEDAHLAEIQRVVQRVWIDGLLEAASDRSASPGVQARLTFHLREVRDWLGENGSRNYETTAHRSMLFDEIDRFLLRLYESDGRARRVTPPPGQPIGSESPAVLRQQERRERLTEEAYCAW